MIKVHLRRQKKTLEEWIKKDIVYYIILEEDIVGFIHISHKGPNVMIIEDIFILEEYRRKGVGKKVIYLLKEKVIDLGKTSLCVNVVPRNSEALDFYEAVGFDHLNMIELRMNFNNNDNRDREIKFLEHIYKI